MAEFFLSIVVVMEHEGGFSDDPADRGGATKWGISLRFLKLLGLDIDHDGDVDAMDIHALTREQAGEIYKQEFWQFDGLKSQAVATKLFDTAVNVSPKAAVKIAQAAVNAIGWMLKVDGVLGPNTLTAINCAPTEEFFREFRARQAEYYVRIILANPTQVKWLLGWMRRAAF